MTEAVGALAVNPTLTITLQALKPMNAALQSWRLVVLA
jgi:hypothetical protein